MRAAPAVTFAAAISSIAGCALGYQWAQTAGGITRANLYPPSAYDSLTGILSSSEDEQSSIDSSRHIGANPVVPATKVPTLVYTVTNSEFLLQKSAPPVVTSSGLVLAISPLCDIVGLPNPDLGGSWTNPVFRYEGDYDGTVNNDCYDLLLDEADNVFHTIHQREYIDNDTVVGYALSSSNGVPRLISLPRPPYPVDTQTSLPLFDVYQIGSLYLPGANPSTSGSPTGTYFMPSTPLLSQGGMAVVSTANGGVQLVEMGQDNQQSGGGSVGIPSASLEGASLAVVTIAPSANDAGGVAPIARAYRSDGSMSWEATATAGVSGVQPHPVYVPGNPMGRLYMVANPNTPGVATSQIFCLYSNGKNCANFPASVPTAIDSWPTGWWYGGALVPSPSSPTKVARLLYTVDMNANADPTMPIGCIVALSPSTGAMVDHYCVARDPAGREPEYNFLGTAPVVAVNARGTGRHIAWVAQYDSIVLGFDPMSLSSGPLYSFDPVPAGDSITLTADYLSVTAGGSLLLVGWRVGTSDSEFVALAIPNAAGGSPGVPQAGNNKQPGLSPASAAAVSIVVVVAVMGAIAFPLYRSGTLGRYLSKFNPSQIRYVPVAQGSGSGYTYSNVLGGSGAKSFFSGPSKPMSAAAAATFGGMGSSYGSTASSGSSASFSNL